MLRPKIIKSSVTFYTDRGLTVGQERNENRWWMRYIRLGVPVWTAMTRKEYVGTLALIKEMCVLERSLLDNDMSAEMAQDYKYSYASKDALITKLFKIEDGNVCHKVKFLFDSTECVVEDFEVFDTTM